MEAQAYAEEVKEHPLVERILDGDIEADELSEELKTLLNPTSREDPNIRAVIDIIGFCGDRKFDPVIAKFVKNYQGFKYFSQKNRHEILNRFANIRFVETLKELVISRGFDPNCRLITGEDGFGETVKTAFTTAAEQQSRKSLRPDEVRSVQIMLESGRMNGFEDFVLGYFVASCIDMELLDPKLLAENRSEYYLPVLEGKMTPGICRVFGGERISGEDLALHPLSWRLDSVTNPLGICSKTTIDLLEHYLERVIEISVRKISNILELSLAEVVSAKELLENQVLLTSAVEMCILERMGVFAGVAAAAGAGAGVGHLANPSFVISNGFTSFLADVLSRTKPDIAGMKFRIDADDDLDQINKALSILPNLSTKLIALSIDGRETNSLYRGESVRDVSEMGSQMTLRVSEMGSQMTLRVSELGGQPSLDFMPISAKPKRCCAIL